MQNQFINDETNLFNEMDKMYIGKIIKIIILNHKRDKWTDKKELLTYLNINKVKFNKYIQDAQEYIKIFGLQIISVQPDISNKDDKYFIIKSPNIINNFNNEWNNNLSYILLHDIKQIETKFCDQTLDNNVIPIEKKQLYTVFAMCEAENDRFEHIEYLSNCNVFRGFDIEKQLQDMKKKGYIKTKIENMKIIYSRNWRYYAEYGDFFNITEFFKLKL